MKQQAIISSTNLWLNKVVMWHIPAIVLLKVLWDLDNFIYPSVYIWWAMLVMGSLLISKIEYGRVRVVESLVVVCLIYCMFLSHFDVATGIGAFMLFNCYLCSYNSFNRKKLIIVSAAHLIVVIYMYWKYHLIEQDPFGFGYALPVDRFARGTSSLSFISLYIMLISFTAFNIAYTIGTNVKVKRFS